MATRKSGTVTVIFPGDNVRDLAVGHQAAPPTLKDVQDLVGGYIAHIKLKDGRHMYVDEDGLLKNLPQNTLATELVDDPNNSPIVGNAVVIEGFDTPTGLADDEEGNEMTDKRMTMGAVSRTKIVRHEGNFYDYQPGNCTRYHLCAAQVVGHPDGSRGFLLTWLLRGETAGPSMFFSADRIYDVSYVANKMGIEIADAMPIMVFMRDMFAIEIYDDPRFDMNTGCAQHHRDWQ